MIQDDFMEIEKIKEILNKRNLTYKINEGHDSKTDEPFVYIEIPSKNPRVYIDLADENTLYFGDWHSHFDPDCDDDIEEFYLFLENILDNKICAVGSFQNDGSEENWCSSSIEEKENLCMEFLKEEFGLNRIIKCNFFDESLNQTYLT